MVFSQAKNLKKPELCEVGNWVLGIGGWALIILIKSHRHKACDDAAPAACRDAFTAADEYSRALLNAELDRGSNFVRLANAVLALYPKDSEGSGYRGKR